MGPEGSLLSPAEIRRRQSSSRPALRLSGILACTVISALITVHWDSVSLYSSKLNLHRTRAPPAANSDRLLLGSAEPALGSKANGVILGEPTLRSEKFSLASTQSQDGAQQPELEADGQSTAGQGLGSFLSISRALFPSPGHSEESDDKLFEAALETEKRRKDTAGSVLEPNGGVHRAKIAFLFIIPGSLPLAKLWCQFLYGHEALYSVYIHLTEEAGPDSQSMPQCFRGAHISSKDVKTGDMSVVDSQRRVLAHALLDPANERFVFLSEGCIPIFNFFFVYNYVMGTNVSFVTSQRVADGTETGWHTGLLPLVSQEMFHNGSPWMAITRPSAVIVIHDQEYYELFKTKCASTMHKCGCLDGCYIPTLLNAKKEAVAKRSLTWAEWSDETKSWASFRGADARPSLVDMVRGEHNCQWNDNAQSYCFLFARKMESDALHNLLTLASAMGY